MNKLNLQICSWNKTRYLVGRQPNVTPKEKEKQTKSKVTTRKKKIIKIRAKINQER